MWSMIGTENGIEVIYETYDTEGEAYAAMEQARMEESEDVSFCVEPYIDDDPQCVCGVYRSEHSMMGCSEGFQTPEQWEREREFIRSLDDDEYERIYGGY